jgi:hypothetical protein
MNLTKQAVEVGSIWSWECFEFFHGDGVRCTHPWDCPEEHRRELKWRDGFENLVVIAGLNKLLDATFVTGLASPEWFAGLKDAGVVDPDDVMGNHIGWAEISPYSNATRPPFVPGAIANGAVNNAGTKASFLINAPETIYGGFLADDDEVDGVGGTLYGAGDFDTERAVIPGDVLNVQVDLVVTTVIES